MADGIPSSRSSHIEAMIIGSIIDDGDSFHWLLGRLRGAPREHIDQPFERNR